LGAYTPEHGRIVLTGAEAANFYGRNKAREMGLL
jgi:hypothetical protein